MYGNKKSHHFDDTNIAPLIERNASWASQAGLLSDNRNKTKQTSKIRKIFHTKKGYKG